MTSNNQDFQIDWNCDELAFLKDDKFLEALNSIVVKPSDSETNSNLQYTNESNAEETSKINSIPALSCKHDTSRCLCTCCNRCLRCLFSLNDVEADLTWLYIGHLNDAAREQLLSEFNVFILSLEPSVISNNFKKLIDFSTTGFKHDYIDTSVWDVNMSIILNTLGVNKKFGFDIWLRFLSTNKRTSNLNEILAQLCLHKKYFVQEADLKLLTNTLLNVNNLLRAVITDPSYHYELYDYIYGLRYKHSILPHYSIGSDNILLFYRRFKYPLLTLPCSKFGFNSLKPVPPDFHINAKNTYICSRDMNIDPATAITEITGGFKNSAYMIVYHLGDEDAFYKIKVPKSRNVIFNIKKQEIVYNNSVYCVNIHAVLAETPVIYHVESNSFLIKSNLIAYYIFK